MIPAPLPLSPVELSDAQRRAVERTGQDVCVVAGPGSGKTRVLTERFAWLVEQQGVDPSRILAITFTEKAATEIKSRLIQRFAGRADLRESIERAWVATIDGFCARVLHEKALDAGVAPDFDVLDQGTADRLLRRAAEEALDELFRAKPSEMRRLLEALDLSTQDDGPQPDLAASLIEVYTKMRVAGLTEIPPAPRTRGNFARVRELADEILRDPTTGKSPTQLIAVPLLRKWAGAFRELPESPLSEKHFSVFSDFKKVNHGGLVKNSPAREAASRLRDELPNLEAAWLGEWYADLHALLREAVAHIAAAYDREKRAEAALDFADLVAGTVQLFDDPHIRAEVASRFDHILMDELQDTNRLQWRLVNSIRRSFFGVGDINQSIYGFRGAEPSVFEQYRAALLASGGSVDELTENHRSRAEILRAVSFAFDGVTGVEPRELIAAKEFEPPQGRIVERVAASGDRAAEVEAALVALRIRELTDPGECKLKDIAVLVRALRSMEAFERAFDRFDIPFLVSGGRRFLEGRETRDLMAFLAALVNPLDEIALVGVLRGPLVGLPDEEIYRLSQQNRDREGAGFHHEAWQQTFEQRFGKLRRMAGFLAPDLLVARALDECGFVAALPERARANVEKLLAWVRREHRRKPRPLAELLDDLESLRFMESEAEAPPPDAADAVRIMTIHQAKGLEFPVVFVGALDGGTDTRRPVIAFSAAQGLGAKWRNPSTGRGQPDSVHAALMEDLKIRETAEENRLLYVAMTRAEERLILSYSERKRVSPWQKLAERSIADCTVADEPPLPPPRRSPAAADTRSDLLIDPPVVTGQYDSSVTATDLALFDSCPRKYYLDRYLGLQPEPDGPGTGAIELGLAVHRALAGQLVDSPEVAELMQRFHRSDLGTRAARATRVEREFDFAIEMDDVVVSGQIDLWFEEGGELLLVDYKTDRDEASADAYSLQLRLYALALERYAGRIPDRAVLYYLRPNRAIEVSLAAEELDAARKSIRALRDAQETLEFPLKPGKQCLRCPFYGAACPAVLV